MTLLDMKRRVLALIEELDPQSGLLTPDRELRLKMNMVIDALAHELARMKKLPCFRRLAVTAGEVLTWQDIQDLCGAPVYQLGRLSGVQTRLLGEGTAIKVLSSGTLELECWLYPEPIGEDTPDSYVFALPADVLQLMPYGVAADLLKADVAAGYGQVYAQRYQTLLRQLDPRWALPGIAFEGGVRL